MSLPPTIIVTVTEEPPGFHDHDGSKTRVFAVHLAFHGSKIDIQALLDRKWTFSAYTWTSVPPAGASAALGTAAAVPATITNLAAAPLPSAKDRFLHWLTDEIQVFPKPSGSTLPPPPSPGTVLQGTIAWDAPLPHMLGLTHVVTITFSEGGSLPDKILILPVAGQTAGKEEPPGTISFDDVALDDSTRATIQANAVALNDATYLPAPLTENGFLRSTFDESAFRLLEAIEAKGASLVTVLSAFLGFLTTLEGNHDTKILLEAGCALALDPLRIALLDPDISSHAAEGAPPRTRREGILLGSLAACVATQLEALQGNLSEDDLNAVCSTFLGNLQDALESSLANAYECLRDHSDLMRTGAGGTLGEWLPLPTSSPTLSQVKEHLGTLSTFLASERGIEMLLKNLLRSIATERLIVASALAASAHVSEAVRALRQGLERYLDLLDGPVNAADAVRADVGYWTLRQVLDATEQSKTSTAATPAVAPAGAAPNEQNTKPEVIDDALRSWSFLKTRLALKSNGFEEIDGSVGSLCRDHFSAAWMAAVDSLLPDGGGSARKRFQPDSVPQPLPISISSAPHSHGLDDFTSHFNGIGVIIRRDSDPWAHANLAAFHAWTGAGKVAQVNGAPAHEATAASIGIRTFLPVAIDGRREMFLRYHGFPLSSDAYRDTIRDEGNQSGLAAKRLPFYAARDVNPDGFQKVPRLVYGRSYQWAAFAVTKGGSLPNILQSTNAPWIPKGDLGDFKDPTKGIIGELKYLRRTAVGATTIVDQERQPARIGVRYPEVFPLALDAPRLCLSAINAGDHVCRASLDLFRNADGSGQLGIEEGDTWSVDFRRLLVTNPEGKAITLFVEWCRWEKGNVAVIYTASGNVSTQNGKDLSVKAKRTDHPAGPCDAWLRLRLETEANYASLAFDPPTVTVKRKNAPAPAAGAAGDPAGTAGESSGSEANKRPTAGDPLPCHADTPPVLLLGADACWAGGFTKSAFAEIILPRVTWLDWEHWCGNRSLAMYGLKRYGNEDAFSVADKHLLTASVLRSLDDEINRLLDRLPDPSVSALIVELTVIDNLLGQQGSVRDFSSPKAMSVVIDCSKISGEAFGDFTKLNTGASSYGADLRNSLIDVDKKCRLGVVVEALPIQSSSNPSFALSSDNDKKAIVIKVCEGTVARLTIRPFVEWPENGHPAFDKGIRQLAVGEATVKNKKGYVFEGATLTIEAMHDPFKEKPKDLATQHESVLQRHIDIVPIANARDYRVFFGPHLLNAEASSVSGAPPTDPWRLFSHVEVRTQRWRFSGRPIYGWIDPNKSVKHRGKNGGSRAAECPAVEQETNDAIKRFEAELFFDRDDADCEFTRVRLTGGRDELLACPWELPSATYFRHAFNFVSRYAGAMRPGRGVPLLPRRQADWSHRVAMLADAPRLEVTRPQARCIVPLTTSPDDDGPAAASPDIEQRRLAPTPPVACILEERPFAVGGLAERMLGEIVTGIGYGFEGKTTDGGAADGNASRVQPLDFAKETSRDGRLSAWAWTPPALPAKDNEQPPKNPSRSFVVETEGPVGLHFEEVTTPAPAWSNCQYLLRPRSLDNGVPLPEESFLGVQLRRFLDPEWIFEPGTSDGRGQDGSGKTSMPWPVQDPCIVRYKLDKVSALSRSLVSVALGDPRRSSPLVTCVRKGTALVISAFVNFLGAGYREESRVLCELPVPSSGPSGELALLHMPHGDGSFTMSIAFLPDDAAATEGRSTAPLIVGTFRWTLNHLVSGGSSAGTGTAGANSSGAPAAGPSAATPTPTAGSSSPADQGSANKSAMLELLVIDGQRPVVRRTAMSQPTYREWTRTAKNADFVTAMINSGIDEPVRVADLAATIKTNSGLEFRRAAGIALSPNAATDSLWLCGSLENSRMPLPVHRYLVGVFTKNASRGGRKYPSFSQARLLVGRNPSLPRQLQLAEADSLTIHEMEVPAKIVVGGNSQQGPLDRFTKAVIDLRATGGRRSDAEPGTVMAYRLHVRFANSPAAMKETTAEVHVKTSQGTMKIQVPKTVQSLDVMWTSAARHMLARFITCIAAQHGEQPTIDPAAKLVSEDSVEVTVPTYSGSGGELWADVSLLHRAVPTEWGLDDESFDQFTFDWLFSAAAAQDDRFPDRRTLVKTLAERFEAQGRFVSSSPPIPIKKFTE